MLNVLNVNELHGSTLYFEKIDKISSRLMRLIKKTGSHFVFCSTEKKFMSASLLFDSVFDFLQNSVASREVYLNNVLRIECFVKFVSVLTYDHIRRFWDECVRCQDQGRGYEVFLSICRDVLEATQQQLRGRAAQYINYVLQNTTADTCRLGIYDRGDVVAGGFTPNTTSLGTAVVLACQRANFLGRSVYEVVHDEQREFGRELSHLFEIAREYPEDANGELGLPVEFDSSVLRGARYEMRSSMDSPGIQLADVVLWRFKKFYEGGRPSRLTEYVSKRIQIHDFSFSSHGLVAPQPIE